MQIGSSDGYSLNEFKFLTNNLTGVEPSKKSCDYARKNFGLKIINKNFEEYNFKDLKYDIIVATHVLEHVFDPIKFLEKCNNLLSRDGLLLIEVPLFDKNELLPFGYFTFEHLNYFLKMF